MNFDTVCFGKVSLQLVAVCFVFAGFHSHISAQVMHYDNHDNVTTSQNLHYFTHLRSLESKTQVTQKFALILATIHMKWRRLLIAGDTSGTSGTSGSSGWENWSLPFAFHPWTKEILRVSRTQPGNTWHGPAVMLFTVVSGRGFGSRLTVNLSCVILLDHSSRSWDFAKAFVTSHCEYTETL